jgi:hypothetical protein
MQPPPRPCQTYVGESLPPRQGMLSDKKLPVASFPAGIVDALVS